MSDLFASAVRVNGYPVISKQEFYQKNYLKSPRPVATLTDDMRAVTGSIIPISPAGS